MYIPKYFEIHELAPPDVFQERGEKAWELLDDRLLITLDALRDDWGRITVNNYEFGGNRMWSGFRTKDSPYGTQFSQHRFGRAADCIFRDVQASVVRAEILHDPNRYPLINSVELSTTWLHFDVRNCDRIKTYNP